MFNKWKKVFFSLLVMVVLTIVFLGGVNAQEKDKVEVVHVAFGNYGDHWVQMMNGAKEMANKLGVVNLTILDGQCIAQKQMELLETAIEMKPDVISIDHGEAAALDPVIEKALNRGIKVITGYLATSVEDIVCDIDQDDYMLAYKSLYKLIQDIGGRGNIAVVHRAGSATIERRMRILPLLLERFPKVEVIAYVPTTAGRYVETTMENLASIFSANPEPDSIKAIWAPFDQFAIGALKACEIAGRDIPIYGVDISVYDLQLMSEPGSNWIATAACDAAEVGRLFVRAAATTILFPEQNIPKYILLPPVLITQEGARSIPEGQFITQEMIPEWGDSGLIWSDELKDLLD